MGDDRNRRLQLVEAALLLDEDLNEAIGDLRAVQQPVQDDDDEADVPGRRRKRKRWWVRPWILRRPLFGQYEQLMVELENEDIQSFVNFTRFDPETFTELLMRIGPRIASRTLLRLFRLCLRTFRMPLRPKKCPSDQQPTNSRIASD